ncbi:MAG TPA: NAD-dependent epimerase/dehydratase family protein [Bacteroidia bacterium]|nr:NAD-dependent epimerase/dehydratase family protein [Bacteroidia bacterium]HRH09854.1 NAD-dependent epimerase/dehydratase family protein [Bacteroidia bacterium]HRH64094.1 NAD-dependent epimerase/dehydratase family protein [Bacteroidia bacterium]
MRIALSGSTGHLGAVVLQLLVEKGFEVNVLQHKKALAFSHPALRLFTGDLNHAESLLSFTSSCDVLIHCAAKISINSNSDASVYETNVKGTQNLVKAAQQNKVKRFIYLSSIHAYEQSPAHLPLNENSPYCTPAAPQYDKSKRDAQQFVLAQNSPNFETLVLNPTAIVGPPDFMPSLMGKAILDLLHKKVPMLVQGGFDFCDVRDVAQAVVAAISKGKPGNSYLLSGKYYTLSDMYRLLSKQGNIKNKLAVIPIQLAYVGLPFITAFAKLTKQQALYTRESLHTLKHGNRHISCAKAQNELGYHCRDFEQTLSDTLVWMKQQNLV